MKLVRAAQKFLLPSFAGIALCTLALPATAVDLTTSDGTWKFSLDGNVNVDYIFSDCQSVQTAAVVAGGLTCVGSQSGSNVSNIGNGLLPAAFVFGVSTTQEGFDIAGYLGLYPGIATNDGGSPNLQSNSANGSSNTALGTTGLDIRQVYMTFGNKDMGTFTLGRNIGLFAADVILNDMTLPGVGGPGSAATASPSNTTLGGIGLGYIYTDWLAQIDYTTPDLAGFNFTLGIFDPINSLSDVGTVEPKKAPGVHAKATYTLPIADGTKLYVSISIISQQQDYATAAVYPATGTTSYSYTGTGEDLFAKLDVQQWEVVGYVYHATGLGTTALFNLGDYGMGQTRTSGGEFLQTTYRFGKLKIGVNYGNSKLDAANAADRLANPDLLSSNRKITGGLYYDLTQNFTVLAEGSSVKDVAQNGGSNTAATVNVGAYFHF